MTVIDYQGLRNGLSWGPFKPLPGVGIGNSRIEVTMYCLIGEALTGGINKFSMSLAPLEKRTMGSPQRACIYHPCQMEFLDEIPPMYLLRLLKAIEV